MKKGTSNGSKPGGRLREEDALEPLLRHATPRPEPPDENRRAVERAVRSEWRAVAARTRWRRRVVGFSLAAAALLAAGVVLFDTAPVPRNTDLREMARVERITGQVRVLAEGSEGEGAALARRMPVYAGQGLRTGGDSGIALRLSHGISLRVDQGTDLVLLDEHTIELASGRVYVDTGLGNSRIAGAGGPGSRFAVFTSKAAVRHLGTQYMVWIGDERLDVSVREGSVRVEPAGNTASTPLRVPEGQALSVDESGAHELAPIESHGERWQWAEALGSGFVLDGRSLADFLDWVASETGHEIVYASDAASSLAKETVLHGEVDLPARQALDVVIMTSDLAAEMRDGVITISSKR